MTLAATLGAGSEPLVLRKAFGTFPTGVAAVAALADDEPAGITVSSFTSVSLDPPMVLVCVAHSSTTWPKLSRADRLGISVLSAGQERVCQQLSARRPDRFSGLPWLATPNGAIFLEGASAWFECSVDRQLPAGDHDIVVLTVHDLQSDHSVAPLVFHASQLRPLDLAPVDLAPVDLVPADLARSGPG